MVSTPEAGGPLVAYGLLLIAPMGLGYIFVSHFLVVHWFFYFDPFFFAKR